MESTVTVSRLSFAGVRYYVQTTWYPASFSMVLTNGRTTWRGDVPETSLREKLIPPGWTLSEYMGRINDCITHQDLTGERYTYDLVENESSLTFKWRISVGTGHKVKGELHLHAVPGEGDTTSVCGIMQTMLEQLRDTSITLEEAQARVKQLEERVQEAELRANRYLQDKNSMQEEMYRRFLAVLNAKKERLREVEFQCHDVATAASTIPPPDDVASFPSPPSPPALPQPPTPPVFSSSVDVHHGGSDSTLPSMSPPLWEGKSTTDTPSLTVSPLPPPPETSSRVLRTRSKRIMRKEPSVQYDSQAGSPPRSQELTMDTPPAAARIVRRAGKRARGPEPLPPDSSQESSSRAPSSDPSLREMPPPSTVPPHTQQGSSEEVSSSDFWNQAV